MRPELRIARGACVALVVAVAAATACKTNTIDASATTIEAPDGGPIVVVAPDADVEQPDAALSLVRGARAAVRVGSSVTVEVALDRRGPPVDVALTAMGLPKGVTFTSDPISSAVSTGKITFTAAADAVRGAATVTLSGNGIEPGKVDLLVHGLPGEIDTSFGGGTVLSPTGTFSTLAIAPDGKVIVGGLDGTKWLVRRFDTAGNADTAFDTAAAAAMPDGGEVNAVTVDAASGAVLVAGSSSPGDGGPVQATIVRLAPSGAADATFGAGGRVVLPTAAAGTVDDLVSSSAGVWLVGFSGASFVRKLDPDGTEDASFTRYDSPASYRLRGIGFAAPSASVSPGSLVLGGQATVSVDGGPTRVRPTVIRLLASGAPDLNFATTPPGTRFYTELHTAGSVGISPGGVAALVGTDQGGSQSAVLTRVDTSGSMWDAFGGAGNGVTRKLGTMRSDDLAYLSWGEGTVDTALNIQRHLADGGLDVGFATGGTLKIEDPTSPDGYKWLASGLRSSAGTLYVVGARTGTSAGAFLMRIWD